MAICSGFSHEKQSFSIAMLNYQRASIVMLDTVDTYMIYMGLTCPPAAILIYVNEIIAMDKLISIHCHINKICSNTMMIELYIYHAVLLHSY